MKTNNCCLQRCNISFFCLEFFQINLGEIHEKNEGSSRRFPYGSKYVKSIMKTFVTCFWREMDFSFLVCSILRSNALG